MIDTAANMRQFNRAFTEDHHHPQKKRKKKKEKKKGYFCFPSRAHVCLDRPHPHVSPPTPRAKKEVSKFIRVSCFQLTRTNASKQDFLQHLHGNRFKQVLLFARVFQLHGERISSGPHKHQHVFNVVTNLVDG